MNDDLVVLISLLILAVLIFLILLVDSYIRNPFKYPYMIINFNVTGTRNPNFDDYIDNYLITNGKDPVDIHFQVLEEWKNKCEGKISRSLFKKRRRKQYEKVLDDSRTFHFTFVRERTRYKQKNYERYPYIVEEIVDDFYCSFDYLMERYKKLESINFEMVLSDYHSKEQRNLMTKELRERVALRDNYTCQICGKYMPDGVGLHIDHIIPISKGGKSVFSNLQVLCSKCNGRKSNK